MRKFISFLILLIIICGGILLGVTVAEKANHNKININIPQTLSIQTKNNPSVSTSIAPTPNLPSHLSIPSIKVNADIEQVGLDAKGNMDVPKSHFTVGWYSLGFRPGQIGNAVIAGHLDQPNSSPAVFWNLPKLKPGDKIIITDSNSKTYTFSVTLTEKYPYNRFPLNDVFGSSDQAGLNLITCEGIWNSESKNYSHRTVVYSKLEE